ncbi:carboxymuconolactone decarboxylase family protein [Micromonospora radicis]|uniref:Carboxymuconolactone decarboxylase-like domain-containing protein n=1 Tax=Micromonospora radicis TaxID=1894971 RepID=A0A418MX12_9ACTN|nr:carboxymuconolactone decarboxylase family protein [Micromonospora radicis]RIV39207.1 hypothetical protein D2L64_10175 [Micromonospora radicis]
MTLWDADEQVRRGLARYASVLGEQSAQTIAARIGAAREDGPDAATAAAVPFAMTWGWLLERPGLSLRDRSLALVSVDVATRAHRALREHLRLALHSGVSAEELRELLLQLGPYVGFPPTIEAREILREVLAVQPTEPSDWGLLGAPAALWRLRVVVRDVRAAAMEHARLLGFTHWRVARLDGRTVRTTMHGRACDGEILVARSTHDGVVIELVEPVSGATSFQQQLATRGPGVHDICVLDADVETTGAAVDRLRGYGVALRQTMELDGARMHWLDTRGQIGGYQLSLGAQSIWDERVNAEEHWDLTGLADPRLAYAEAPVAHLGVVVRDLEAATRAYAAIFGQGEWPVLEFDSRLGSLTDARYEGRAVPEAFVSSSAAVGGRREAQLIGGGAAGVKPATPDLRVEVIQPVNGPSRYREGFLRQRGEGVHHLYFGPVADQAGWVRLESALAERGVDRVTYGRAFDETVEYAYFATLERLGYDLEVFLHHAAIDRSRVARYVMRHR